MHKQIFTGPELPYPILGGAMASSPDGNGVILFGGYRLSAPKGRYIDSILELRSDGQTPQGWARNWKTHTIKLQNARGFHVVIPVVMDVDDCEFHGYKCSNKHDCLED